MKSKYDDVEVTGSDREVVTVLGRQSQLQSELAGRIDGVDTRIDAAVGSSEALLRELGIALPLPPTSQRATPPALPAIRPWAEIVAEAEAAVGSDLGIGDILSGADIRLVESKLTSLRGEFDDVHRLDGVDWAIAGVVGSLAALVDTFLVHSPRSPGMLGSQGAEGGSLSNFMRERIRSAYSPDEIRELEAAFRVPYDAASSRGLPLKVPGLGPRSHRFQSLGHDPLLGFIIGVADILQGRMTAIGSDGRIVSQATSPAPLGMALFEAIAIQFGHLRSDVATPGGLPAPLMPLLQFVQKGSFGKQGYTVGQVSRQMYRAGYDFGHFLAMSTVPALIEVLVRVAYCVKRLCEGHDLDGALPVNLPGRPRQPKLQTMLFTAHLIATGVNAGRFALSKNPMGINYAEWLAFGKSALQQLRWTLLEKESQRSAHLQQSVNARWVELDAFVNDWGVAQQIVP